MKRIKYIAISSLSVATLLLGMSACSNLDELAESSDGTFALTASSSSVAVSTRADKTTTFAEGTHYYLYALDAASPSWSANYMNSTPDDNYTDGVETSGKIVYTGNNKFSGKTLNFYGVTESSTTTRNFIKAGSGTTAPTVTATYTTESGSDLKVLPDYMWTNLNGQSFKNAGTITLPFIHTTSKLNFYVNAGDEASQELSINAISLLDYASGILDMTSGKFTADASLRNETSSSWNQVFSGSQQLTSTSTVLKDNSGNSVERYIFPTRDNTETFTSSSTDAKKNSLGIKISLSNGNSFTYWTKEVAMDSNNQPLKSGNDYVYKPFQFDPNYQYDVLLTVTSKALVVTILPRYYGWIDNNETQSNTTALTEIGTPVTFGGVVWADRNLGATSADPTKSEMDWERSRGWYYQFGRSIPYYIKGSMQDPNHLYDSELVSFYNGTSTYNTSNNNVPVCQGHVHSINAKPFPYVYGHYDEAVISDSRPDISQLAVLPSDNSSLKFNYVDNSSDWSSDGSSVTNWKTESKQPCPKGWRLPTYKEFMTIYPSSKKAGDITFNKANAGNTYYTEGDNQYWTITSTLDIDKAVYLGVKATSAALGTIYAIKNPGTDKAYRIMWTIETVGDDISCTKVENANDNGGTHSQVRGVLVVRRFPATKGNTLTYDNYTSYDWSHPSETLYLPISGYIHQDKDGVSLIYAGCEGIYWTSDVNGTKAYTIRIKYSGDQYERELFGWGSENVYHGCQVRCVRDDSVKD